MKHLIALIFMLPLLGACTSHVTPKKWEAPQCPLGSTYDVRVSPVVKASWKDGINRGLSRWSLVLGSSFRYAVRETPDAEPLPTTACVISFQSGVDQKVWGETTGYRDEDGVPDSFVVWVNDENEAPDPDDVEYATVLHELGHVFGLSHNSDRDDDSVMWPKITVPGRLGCTDVKLACTHMGCEVPTCEKNTWFPPDM